MSYKTEFPDFDASTMPAIPSTWVDISWGNDACPSFHTPEGLRVWIDYADSEMREFAGFRFIVTVESETAESYDLIQTDDWSEVIRVTMEHAKQNLMDVLALALMETRPDLAQMSLDEWVAEHSESLSDAEQYIAIKILEL